MAASDVSPALAAVVRVLMAKQPEQRPQSPVQVIAMLRPFLNGGEQPRPPQHRPFVVEEAAEPSGTSLMSACH